MPGTNAFNPVGSFVNSKQIRCHSDFNGGDFFSPFISVTTPLSESTVTESEDGLGNRHRPGSGSLEADTEDRCAACVWRVLKTDTCVRGDEEASLGRGGRETSLRLQ